MSVDHVLPLFIARLVAAPGLSPILYPNRDAGVQQGTHLRLFIIPGMTWPIGLASTDLTTGIVQVSIYVTPGIGAIIPAQIAKQIIDLFPRNLEMSGVMISGKPWESPALNDNAWYVVPVSIPYQMVTP